MASPSDAVIVEADGRALTVTHPHKVFFPQHGRTKLDLVHYYLAVREPFLRTMRNRPTLMQRFPDGVGGTAFFQKRVGAGAPEWLRTTTVRTPNGTASRALVIADLAHALWAVNLGCLGFHPWPTRVDGPGRPDELRIDLDPAPGVTFAMVREAARCARALLDELGIASYPKTSGGRGMHVYVAITPRWDAVDVRAAAVAVARELARRHPALITDAWWKEERGTRVFVDFNQNAPHRTVFGPWSVRPRPGAQVSTPLSWADLDAVDPDELTMDEVPGRLRRLGDPWAAMYDAPQPLEPLLALAERDRAAGLPDAPWPPEYPKMPGEPPRVAPSRARKPGPPHKE